VEVDDCDCGPGVFALDEPAVEGLLVPRDDLDVLVEGHVEVLGRLERRLGRRRRVEDFVLQAHRQRLDERASKPGHDGGQRRLLVRDGGAEQGEKAHDPK
jgi:hypothetical protein